MANVTRLKFLPVHIASLSKLGRNGGPLNGYSDWKTHNVTNKVKHLIKRVIQSSAESHIKETSKVSFSKSELSQCKVDPDWEQPKVIIVGAGIAGLSAAQRLLQSGFHNFMILEATSRPGGRINTTWMGDSVIEHGPEEILGCLLTNSAYTLASEEGLLKSSNDQDKKETKETFCDMYISSDGRSLVSTGLEEIVFEKVIRQAQELYKECQLEGKKHKGNLHHYIAIRLQQELLDFPPQMRYDAERIMFGRLNNIQSKVGADLSEVSAQNFGSTVDPPGENKRIPLGFVGILAPILRQVPQQKIFYKNPVLTVYWGERPVMKNEEEERVTVVTCDGAEYEADYCIVTVPLGVLKDKMDTMFYPALPEEKRNAITCLGFGHQCKVFLEYDRPFWLGSQGKYRFAWSQEELSEKDCDWSKSIGEVKKLEGSKQILTFTVGGNQALFLQTLTDDQLAVAFTGILRKLLGDPALPYPNFLLKTEWSKNEHFLGCNSFMSIGSTMGHLKDLSREIKSPCGHGENGEIPTLFFAGEATAKGAQGTVHGARSSGISQAEKILDLTHKFKGKPTKQKNIDNICQ